MSNPTLTYAYHIDAGFYAKFLRRIAENAGALRIEGKVENVVLDDSGYIKNIRLASGTVVEGDFFIDLAGNKRKSVLLQSVRVSGAFCRFKALISNHKTSVQRL